MTYTIYCIPVVSKVQPGGQMQPHDIFYAALSFILKLYYKKDHQLRQTRIFQSTICQDSFIPVLSFLRGQRKYILLYSLPYTSSNVSYLCFVQGTHLPKDYLH